MRVWLAPLLLVMLSGCVQFLTGELEEPVPAPDLHLQDIDGQWWNITEADGAVLLDFMGTWCGPCQRSVPLLRDIQAAYPELQILSVSGTDSPADMRDFKTQYNAPWPHIVDGDAVRDVHRAVMGDASFIWPSYAIVRDGDITFYSRGETLPATFTAALDGTTARTAPDFDATAIPLVGLAGVLGMAAYFSPFLLRHTIGEEPRRPKWSVAVGLGLYLLLAWVATHYSRPISGRIVNVAPILAAAGALAIVYWRMRGTARVQADGKHLDGESPSRRTVAFWISTLWYLLPAYGAVLYAAMLRTAPGEALALLVAFGGGLAIMDAVSNESRPRAALQSLEERAGWIGAGALVVGVLWNSVLYLR